ncbi:MAG: hypothetical protein LBB31_03480, partial [Prevotellaceae bacterium]|nr:hypothetical protein [Prevotellaceae bacterium]
PAWLATLSVFLCSLPPASFRQILFLLPYFLFVKFFQKGFRQMYDYFLKSQKEEIKNKKT